MNPAIFYMLKWERDAAEQGRSRAKKCGPQLHSGGTRVGRRERMNQRRRAARRPATCCL